MKKQYFEDFNPETDVEENAMVKQNILTTIVFLTLVLFITIPYKINKDYKELNKYKDQVTKFNTYTNSIENMEELYKLKEKKEKELDIVTEKINKIEGTGLNLIEYDEENETMLIDKEDVIDLDNNEEDNLENNDINNTVTDEEILQDFLNGIGN